MAQTKVTDAMRNVTTVDGTKISGAVPSGALTNVDLSKLEYNQAILAFKVASANQLAKFSMVDQVIDEYQDATGIDAGASTNERAAGATTAKYYDGASTVTPTVSGNYDSTATDGDYTYYKWTTVRSDGTYTTNTAQDYEYLVIGGGGGGGKGVSSAGRPGGGGGAGAFRHATGFAVAATTISGITVGAGGIGGTGSWGSSDTASQGGDGADSVFSTITADGGGAGAAGHQTGTLNGRDGGSGGGGDSDGPVGEATLSGAYGNDGGLGGGTNGGGGGGMGSAGGSANGGAGVTNSITGASVSYAGGGAGNVGSGNGTATHGGGAAAVGTANTGGGGGGMLGSVSNGFAGGSGIVIIRRLTSIESSGGNLTLQSVATTAESAPTTADLVVLIEDSGGTPATINVDIKAKVSRDGSAFSGYVTFVDEGDWGSSKRILVARNIDISGITSGVAMKYRVETLNQSSSKSTRIHATSLAWA